MLLGEPVIRMPSSEFKFSLDTPLDSVKALDHVKLSGSVEGLDNGYVDLILREGRTNKKMSLEVSDDSVDVFYDGGLIYSEKVPVKGKRCIKSGNCKNRKGRKKAFYSGKFSCCN